MNDLEWSAWAVEYNPASDMYDVYSCRTGETLVHSSWNLKNIAEQIAARLNAGEQI